MNETCSTRSKSRLPKVRVCISLAGATVLAISLSQQAVAQDKKMLLKTPSAFNTQLPVIGTSAPYFADLAKKLTGNTIRFKLYEPGKLISGIRDPQVRLHRQSRRRLHVLGVSRRLAQGSNSVLHLPVFTAS